MLFITSHVLHIIHQLASDSRFLFVINDGKVHAYNAATGELASVLGSRSQIVALSPDSPNHRQLFTCDSEGTMMVWDFLLGVSLKVSPIWVNLRPEGGRFCPPPPTCSLART